MSGIDLLAMDLDVRPDLAARIWRDDMTAALAGKGPHPERERKAAVHQTGRKGVVRV